MTPPLTHLAPATEDARVADVEKARRKKGERRRQAQLAEKEKEGAHLLKPRPDQKRAGGARSLSTLIAAAGNAGTRPWAEQEGDGGGGGGGGDVPLIDFISLAATAGRVRALSCEPLAPLAKPTTGLNCENSSRITSVPPADIAAVFAVSQKEKKKKILSVSGDCKRVDCGPIQI